MFLSRECCDPVLCICWQGVEKAGAHAASYIILRLCVGKELNSYSGMQFAIEKTNNKVFRMVYHK